MNFAVILVAGLAGVLAALAPVPAAVAVIATTGTLIALRSRQDALVILASASCAALIAEAVLPPAFRLSLLAVVVVAAVGLFLRSSNPQADAPARFLVLTGSVVGWWALQIANPNVPAITTGVNGVRLATFFWIGLVFGAGLAAKTSGVFVVRLIAWVLLAALLLALALHFLAPAVELTVIARKADVATATYQGSYRLAGLFSGPFHAALAAVVLVVLAVDGYIGRRSPTATAALQGAVGALSLLAAQVRSAYVAAVVGVVYVVLSRRTNGVRIRGRLVVAAAIASLSLVALRYSASAASLKSTGTDSRFLGRLDSYRQGLALVRQQPFLGYGAGSAGDAMATDFGTRVHITAHNVVLKMAVEGGLIGALLFGVLLYVTWRRLKSVGGDISRLARALVLGFLTMGTTGSISEALPVAFWLFVIVGAALSGVPPQGEPASQASSRPRELWHTYKAISGPRAPAPQTAASRHLR